MSSILIPEYHKNRLEYLGAFLRLARIIECKSIIEACEKMDINKNTLLRVENGENSTLVTLFKIADYYKIPISELFLDID